MFLLDTDIVSNFRKQKPHPELIRWIAQIGWDQVSMSAMTVTEIQIGIERAKASDADTATRISNWLDGLLEDGTPQVIPIGALVARLYGRMYEAPGLRNFVLTRPGSTHGKTGADLCIAATAITHELVVVTHNVDDFVRINAHFPLPGLFDPFEGAWKIRPSES